MNNLYMVLVSLLSLAGLAAFSSGSFPQQVKEPMTRLTAARPDVSPEDTTKVTARATKKKKKERKPSAATITMKRELNRATISQRSTEGSNVEIVIMNSGVTMRNVEDLQMIGSSGSPVSSSSYIGFDNVSFPFEGNVRFKAPNKMGTVVYDREVRFKVNEPGRWTVRVDL